MHPVTVGSRIRCAVIERTGTLDRTMGMREVGGGPRPSLLFPLSHLFSPPKPPPRSATHSENGKRARLLHPSSSFS